MKVQNARLGCRLIVNGLKKRVLKPPQRTRKCVLLVVQTLSEQFPLLCYSATSLMALALSFLLTPSALVFHYVLTLNKLLQDCLSPFLAPFSHHSMNVRIPAHIHTHMYFVPKQGFSRHAAMKKMHPDSLLHADFPHQ